MANKKATRESYGEALAFLADENKDIVVLDADLSKSTKTELFQKKAPERFFDCGIAEGNSRRDFCWRRWSYASVL